MRPRRVLAVLSAVLCLLVVTVGEALAAPVHTTTAWRDDFNSLNTRTWQKIGWGCFDPANVTVSSGLLRLKTVATSSAECPLVGGRLDTFGKRTFAPGTYTARIKFAPKTGSWQTFWMTGGSG